MSASGPLDGPIELSRLVPPGELEELLDAVHRATGADLAIYDPTRRRRLVGSEAAGAPRYPVEYQGELLAVLAAAGERGDAALDLASDALGLLVHHASARDMAATMHEEAMRLTFAELTEHNNRL